MKSISLVVEAFRHELSKLHEKMDWPSYHSTELSIKVKYCPDAASFELVFEGGRPFVFVKGTNLGKVMDEVYRRLGYEHQATAMIETSMLALEAPRNDEFSDEVPF